MKRQLRRTDRDLCLDIDAGVSCPAPDALAPDDEQARGLRLLLLGKGAVFAHRFERSLTAEMDEQEQPGLPLPSGMGSGRSGAPAPRCSCRANCS